MSALPKDFSVAADVNDFVKKCGKWLGDSKSIGLAGFIDDLPDYYKSIGGSVQNKILAYVVVHSKSPLVTQKALLARKKQLSIDIQPDVIEKAIALAKNNKNLSLDKAQKLARQA